MTSIPLPDGQSDDLPELFQSTFEEMIIAAERELEAQRRRLRQMRRQRQRQQRRNAARWARAHSRVGLFWGGSLAFAVGAAFALPGMYDIAVELFKVAVAAWIAAASAQQPRG
ncbi:hypothetical protein [Streptomyces yerevanensis]|uniref:hypothetical protein n=1 Tax=Streptomyces yerevanensis TaxID=66378 RepID=UPI000527F4DB|nr:hypothetical protein [Streptomyces yerevanensis]